MHKKFELNRTKIKRLISCLRKGGQVYLSLISLYLWHFFQFPEYIEAGVRVLGCACDDNGNMSLSWEEVSTEKCIFVQDWVFGEHLDENAFDMVDADGSGTLEGCEVAQALEEYFEDELSG